MKSEYADLLGNLKAEMSSLSDEADAAKAVLISMAANQPGSSCAIEGEAYRAAVTFADKRVTDYKALLADLSKVVQGDLIDRLVAKHTRVAEGVPTVRVGALVAN
jgi:hypothetical protein